MIEKEAEARGWKADPAVRSKIEEYTRSLYRNTLLQSLKDTQKSISDEEAKKYFQEHEEEFIQPDRIRLSLIETGLDQEKEINAAYKEVRAGKDFAQLASAHSKHPSSKNGGDLGFLTRKQYKHLTEVAFTLKPGEISKPFKSPTGWHIIKVTELIKKQDIPLEEGVKRAKARLEAMEASKAYDALMKGLREKNNVVLYEDRLKQLQPAAEGALEVLLAHVAGAEDAYPTQLIEQALKLDPNNAMGQWLAGTAAFEVGDHARAVNIWEKLLKQLPPDLEGARTLTESIAKARAAAKAR